MLKQRLFSPDLTPEETGAREPWCFVLGHTASFMTGQLFAFYKQEVKWLTEQTEQASGTPSLDPGLPSARA